MIELVETSHLLHPAQVNPVDPIARFTELATRHGLIRHGDKLDQMVVDFACDIVNLAARVGDAYGDSEGGGNAGEHIRAELLPP